ncbi:hypothetical protein NEUTE2DRAFT_133423 [Neurospora tetrasperma FGSC 2509]|nr:hypothetical protein NEUTE2DRAFT_133423 [Neurospora tetrasperma FGSC 2509]
MDRSRAENPTKTATRFRFVARPDILGPYDAYIKLVFGFAQSELEGCRLGGKGWKEEEIFRRGAGEWREEGGQLSCGFSFDK